MIGLGNPLMGDEGIGWHIAERLRNDPRLPAHVEVISGGTDLLRCAGLLDGRQHVIVVDALLNDEGRPGDVLVASDRFDDYDSRQPNAHSLSAVQAVELLRAVIPGLDSVRFTLIAIRIGSAAIRSGLSTALAAEIPRISKEVMLKCVSPCPAES